MYDYKKIIKNITQIRKLKNITQEELANKSGIKRSNLSRLEQGKVVPKIDTLCKIYNVLSAKIPD